MREIASAGDVADQPSADDDVPASRNASRINSSSSDGFAAILP
jgi:hypothetical protein